MARQPITKSRRAELMLNARQSMDTDELVVKTKKRKAARQAISRQETYPLEEFLKRTGLSKMGYRKAIAAGLKCTGVGDSTWISGEEWHRFIAEHANKGV